MGNTRTYYLEGELLPGTTLEQFKEAVYAGFHSTYCVAEIVEEKGGYLGGDENGGPFLLAAVHSYSMVGDCGPDQVARLFKELDMHRVDYDLDDVWICRWKDGKPAVESRADLNWNAIGTHSSTAPS